MSESIKEGAQCKREGCEGSLMLTEIVHAQIYDSSNTRMIKQERYNYICNIACYLIRLKD